MWHKRMQDLSRGVGRPHAPLFAPMVFGVAACVEAIDPLEMASNPTRLRKNVSEIRRMLKMDAVFACVPSDAESMAFGAAGSEITPEKIVAHERLGAALEAVRQWQADATGPVIVAAISGPATLVRQWQDGGSDASVEALFEHAGHGLALLARLFCEAGIHVLQWHESAAVDSEHIDHWKSALGTAGNVARFHRVPPLLVMDVPTPPPWPPQAIACPTPAQPQGAANRPHGLAWPGETQSWPAMPLGEAGERWITTTQEVPVATDIARLLADVRRVQEA